MIAEIFATRPKIVTSVQNRWTKALPALFDLEEALGFAAQGKVKPTIEQLPLESINEVFKRLKEGKVNGRVVLNAAQSQH